MVRKENTRLNSWKQIAAYLDREVRTVMRWEREKGIPVHRLPGGRRPTVFAYTNEIDKWLSSVSISTLDSALYPQWFLTHLLRLKGTYGMLLLAVLLVLIASIASLLLFRDETTPSLSRISSSGTQLVAWSREGKVRWTRMLPGRMDSHERLQSHFEDLDGDGDEEILVPVSFPAERSSSAT